MDKADYVLTRGCQPIALLREIERDQPVVRCEFHAFPAFEDVRPVLQALRDEGTWRAFFRVLRLRLVVNGDRASFRFAVGRLYVWRFRRWAKRQGLQDLG